MRRRLTPHGADFITHAYLLRLARVSHEIETAEDLVRLGASYQGLGMYDRQNVRFMPQGGPKPTPPAGTLHVRREDVRCPVHKRYGCVCDKAWIEASRVFAHLNSQRSRK